MVARHYPVIIERGTSVDGSVSFGAFFPDLPGCTSGGDTINLAILGAEEALAGHVALMVRDGDPLPEPTPLDQIEHDPEVIEVMCLLVRVEIPAKWVRDHPTYELIWNSGGYGAEVVGFGKFGPQTR